MDVHDRTRAAADTRRSKKRVRENRDGVGFFLSLAEALGKSLRWVQALDYEETLYWMAYTEIRQEKGGKHDPAVAAEGAHSLLRGYQARREKLKGG